MPQYYTGANPETALSSGLMAGFEFVDRIQSRRRQLELQERQMGLAENADQRAEDAAGRAEDEYAHTKERRPILEGREDTDAAFALSERNRAVGRRDEDESARLQLAGAMLEGGGGAPSLQNIADGAQRRAPPNVPQTAQPASVPQTAQPAAAEVPKGPVDLRAAQTARDNDPGVGGLLKKLFVPEPGAAKAANAKNFWNDIAADSNTVGLVYDPDTKKGVDVREIRRNPAPYAGKYLADRKSVSPQLRQSLDLTMGNALKEQLAGLDPKDQRSAGKAQQLNTQLGQLAKATTASAAADGGITRPVKIDDTRVVPAITNAVAKARNAQDILETSPNEMRAATTVVSRIGGSKRLNPAQISALTTLYAHGGIGAEELNNWSKYGTPIAPKQPSVTALGGGYAAIVSEQGVSIMALPGGAGGKETAASQSNRRLLVNDRMKQAYEGIKGMVKAGELSDGSESQHFNEFLQTVKREAPQLQLKTGVPLIGPDGALNLADADPGEIAELLDSYAKFDAGEKQPWFFKGNKSFADYAPQGAASGEEIIDLTSHFQ